MKDLMVASQQGKSQFIAEIATISAVQHRNLVKLHGFCIKENKRLLVYEYLENKSLDRALFGMKITTSILHCYEPLKKFLHRILMSPFITESFLLHLVVATNIRQEEKLTLDFINFFI